MLALRVVPKVFYFDTFKEFNDEFKIGKNDLVVTNEFIYEPFMKPLGIETNLIFQEKFGTGEPSDEMIDAMTKEMKKFNFDRIIAFGGGTIVDICKILALDVPEHSIDLFEGTVLPVKKKELILVPTTCGTGSEVTNVAIAELKSKHTKKGIAVEKTYGDCAVLIPETVKGLPYKFFVTSSIDALIHAIESYLSPKASPFTEMYSLKAIEMIMEGYKKIIANGPEARLDDLKTFVLAANYAGIAFGNAGCAAVHALSYSIGGTFHVPHGEANYQFFTEVFKMYDRKNPNGKIVQAKEIFANVLGCDAKDDVFGALEEFLNKLIAKKPLREYGMVEAQIDEFTESTIANQQRLLANNYVPLSKEEIREIFNNLY
ncbi:4-hydroxybutyrate dehydrogenase [Anaerovorax sp. IOR16]|uniref:4-hydroxybutyrate dehydrogenase n=1 Tax=Anaerovorax sp. IOR16 TaxID=2773458 RepID=UPI0019D03AAC|nr:4-hydroxybutyrate dehydrogenase [Anaerovorax sp. IOR16]